MTTNLGKSDGLVYYSVKNAAVLCKNHRERVTQFFEILRDFLYYHILRVRAIPTYRIYRLYDVVSFLPLILPCFAVNCTFSFSVARYNKSILTHLGLGKSCQHNFGHNMCMQHRSIFQHNTVLLASIIVYSLLKVLSIHFTGTFQISRLFRRLGPGEVSVSVLIN